MNQEVGVEHGDQLAGREVIWMGKEAAREYLQCQVPRGAGN